MAEKVITNHKVHLKQLIAKANSDRPADIKELVDYLILAHASGHTEVILERGVALVQKHPDFLSDENLYLVEEFFYAACELQQFEWAQFFLQMIRLRIPQSIKVMRMLAILYEAQGESDKAQNILVDLVESNPADKQSVKRLVSLYRDMQWHNEAIAVLNKFVETNQEDVEAWNELADMYLARQNYAKAIYCFEEMIMQQPKNYLVNLKYAEMLYSTKRDRLDDLIDSRKYFMHAAMLREEGKLPCVRALFGVIKTCKAIAKLSNKASDKDVGEMIRTAQEQIQEVYEKRGCGRAKEALSRMPSMQEESQ